MLKRGAADSGGRCVYLSDAGNGGSSGDPIGGKRVAVVDDGCQRRHSGIALGPGEGTDGGGHIDAPAEGMRLQGHGLGLGQARFLHGNSVKQDSSDGDRVDGRMDENVCRNTRGSQSSGGDPHNAGCAGAAGAECLIPTTGAGYAVGGNIEDRSIAGGVGDGRVQGGAGGRLNGGKEDQGSAQDQGRIAGGGEENLSSKQGRARLAAAAACRKAPETKDCNSPEQTARAKPTHALLVEPRHHPASREQDKVFNDLENL